MQEEYDRLIDQRSDQSNPLIRKSLADGSQLTEKYLNQIDQRLFKLQKMYFEFKTINCQHINLDTTKLDKQAYLTDLINLVKRRLCNEAMENLSDGVRHQFIQWIRINILKPLQTIQYYIQHRLESYLNMNHTPRSITFFAGKTEKTLYDLGQKICNQLTILGAMPLDNAKKNTTINFIKNIIST